MYRILFLLLTLILPYSLMAQKVQLAGELTKEEMSQLESGELILKTSEIEGSAWPEITQYLIVKASALETMGIFSALDYQKDYVPNVLKSKPIKHLSAVEVLTEYEMHVPFPLPNAHYTHGSIIHQYDEDYELTWYKVESSSTEEVKGSAYFTPYKNFTLFRYRSFIKPKSIFGSLVKKMMLRDVKNSVLVIRDHIEKLKSENSPLLSKYSGFISAALKGEMTYSGAIESK